MPHPVYSTCFLSIANVPGLITYDVPAGDTGLLHNMFLFVRIDNAGGGLKRPFTVALDQPEGIVWQIDPQRTQAGVYQWSGRDVFTAHLFMDCPDLFAYSFRASGYLLAPP